MPQYLYSCKTCPEQTITRQEPIHATTPPPLCLACAKQMNKQYAPPAVTFRGNGFYITDKQNTQNK